MNDWQNLEHRLWHELKEHQLEDAKILVGFSGGVDSLALLWALCRVKKTEVIACYVHHGEGASGDYRHQAFEYCHQFCFDRGIPFYTRRHRGEPLRSEAQFREFRLRSLREVQTQTGAGALALGHHRDDLLETRLLRLIRGAGPQGLGAMRGFQDGLFRPFLKISKKELKAYLDDVPLKAFEDPSNGELEPLRNWLRQEWLVSLENRQEGAVNALARSLEVLADFQSENEAENVDFHKIFEAEALSRPRYLALSKSEQKRALARFLLVRDVRDFTQAQLEEIQKRLDNSQKAFTFKVAGREWVINAQQIRVQDLV